MKNSLVKFQKQDVTIFDKNGNKINPKKPKRKNAILFLSIIGISILTISFFLTKFALTIISDNKETSKADSLIVNDQTPETNVKDEPISYRDEKTFDFEKFDEEYEKSKIESKNCGIIEKKGVIGDNYWVDIKDNKTGKKVRINNMPSFVWEYSEIGLTEICE